MELPYEEPLTVKKQRPRVIPEPPRRGEPGGEPCGLYKGGAAGGGVGRRALHPPSAGRRQHARPPLAREPRARRLVLRPLARGGAGIRPARRAHRAGDPRRRRRRARPRYRWGDGGAHFHVWLLSRPLGMLEAKNFMLPLWEDVLPTVSDEELREAAERIAARL